MLKIVLGFSLLKKEMGGRAQGHPLKVCVKWEFPNRVLPWTELNHKTPPIKIDFDIISFTIKPDHLSRACYFVGFWIRK